MFSFSFNKKSQDIFKDKHYPKLRRIFHNYNTPDWTYNYHLHKNSTEIVYIANGKATYTIDMETFILEKGHILIMEKGVLHSISSDTEKPVDAWTIIIDDYTINGFSESNRLLNSSTYAIIKTGIHDLLIKSIMEEIRTLCIDETLISQFTCNMLATSLVSLIYGLLPEENLSIEKKKSSFVRDILVYISEHYNEPITLKKLSDVFHVSAGHISHAFTKEYTVSPINYAIDLRICEAKLLLLNTDESLTSISNKVGYTNISHFSNIFTNRVNCSPLEFREKHSKSKKNSSKAKSYDMNSQNTVLVSKNTYDEIQELKDTIDKLKNENNILQKAMTILASENITND